MVGITGLVTALRAEASCVLSTHIPYNQIIQIEGHTALWLSGMGPQAARIGAEGLQQNGAAALVSFGIAGALDSNLKPGDLLLPDTIYAGRQFPVDRNWRDHLQGLLPTDIRVTNGILASSEVPLTSEKEKLDLAKATGGRAVDMESGTIAAVAAAAGIPFIAVRAIIDPVQFSPPQALLDAVYPDGGVNPIHLFILILKRSVQLRTLLQMGSGMRAARKTLSRVIQSVGTTLGRRTTD